MEYIFGSSPASLLSHAPRYMSVDLLLLIHGFNLKLNRGNISLRKYRHNNLLNSGTSVILGPLKDIECN